MRRTLAVVVLGDLDRSPRMCNHAAEAARHNFQVELIGYRGSSLPQAINGNQNIHVTFLNTQVIDWLRNLPRYLYLVYAILRVIIQISQLCVHLLIRRRYNYILIQNPPCVPLLLVAIIVRFMSFGRTRLIIDWHNYGFSIMRVGGSHPVLVRMAMHYETFLGRFGDKHLTVSDAMRRNLTQITAIRPQDVYVLYDRATSKFRPISNQEKADFFERVGLSNMQNCRVLLSSTSYTPDEDFMILVRALDIVDRIIKSKLQVIVTGKGPQKAFYDQVFRERNANYKNVNIRQVWLHSDDYPVAVASADLGVCLHFSSSGFDLPMKVVDMFSAGLPCLAIGGYPSLRELVVDGVNGRVFGNFVQLSDQILELLSDPNETGLNLYRKNLQEFRTSSTWSMQWEQVMAAEILKQN